MIQKVCYFHAKQYKKYAPRLHAAFGTDRGLRVRKSVCVGRSVGRVAVRQFMVHLNGRWLGVGLQRSASRCGTQ